LQEYEAFCLVLKSRCMQTASLEIIDSMPTKIMQMIDDYFGIFDLTRQITKYVATRFGLSRRGLSVYFLVKTIPSRFLPRLVRFEVQKAEAGSLDLTNNSYPINKLATVSIPYDRFHIEPQI
jgi:hypothetical protein